MIRHKKVNVISVKKAYVTNLLAFVKGIDNRVNKGNSQT